MRNDTGKEDGPFAAGRGMDAIAASQGGSAKDTEFPHDKHGRPYLDAAAFDVHHALRFFALHAGESPALLAALLIAWAIRGWL